MTSISNNMYANILDDIVDKYNNAFHSTIKVKPVNIISSTYINLDKMNNKEDSQFKVDDHVRISNIKTLFAKSNAPNRSEKVKSTVLWTQIISDLKGEEMVQTFYSRELQKTNQKKIRKEGLIKRKGDKL